MAKRGRQRLAGSTLGQHLYALNGALKAMRSNPWAVVINTAILGISISLSLALYSGVRYLSHQKTQLPSTHTVYLELAPNVPAEARQKLRRQISDTDLVTRTQLRAGQQTLDETLSRLTLENSADLKALEPFADTLIIDLDSRGTSDASLERILDNWRQNRLVDHLSVYKLGAKADNTFTMYSQAFSIVAVLVLFSVALMSANMVRNQLLRQRLEVQITRYCGGDPAFLRRPFLYWGTIQVVLGTLTALLIFQLAEIFLRPEVARATQIHASEFSVPFGLGPTVAVLILIGGGVLGLCSAWLTTKFHLRTDIDA